MTVGIWGKLGGAGIGLAIGGPIGGLVGGVAGHFLVDREGAIFGATPRDVVFTTGLVALAAKMAKSDGVVTPSEVEASPRSSRSASGSGLASNGCSTSPRAPRPGSRPMRDRWRRRFATNRLCWRMSSTACSTSRRPMVRSHEAEERYLRAVAETFGFDDVAFRRIAARHVRLADDPYLVLDLDHEATIPR